MQNFKDEEPKKLPDSTSNENIDGRNTPNSSQNEQNNQIRNFIPNENKHEEDLPDFSSNKKQLENFESTSDNQNDENSRNENIINTNQINNDNNDNDKNDAETIHDKKTDESNNNDNDININGNDNDNDNAKDLSIHLANAQKIEIIGQGNYGEVFKVKVTTTENGIDYSVKVFYMNYQDYTRASRIEIAKHMSVVRQFNFPSVLRIYDYSKTGFGKEHRQTILTEYCSNGSLEKALTNAGFTKTKKLINIFGIAAALRYIHRCGYYHYDLKPSTILEDDKFHPKLSDIGYSKYFQGLKSMAKIKEFSPYIAPEVLTEDNFTEKSEVYSFSLIVYEIVTNKKPYQGLSQYDLLTKLCEGGRPEIPNDVPKAYSELITKCWDNDPTNRWSFDDILSDLRNNNEYKQNLEDKEEYNNYIKDILEFESDNNPYQKISAESVDIPEDEKKTKKVKKKKKAKPKSKNPKPE